jgi:outer membrane protein
LKKRLVAVSMACLLSLAAETVAADKIAFIDLTQMVEQLPQQQEVIRQLQAEFNSRASELQLIERRAVDKLKKLERDSAIMKASERSVLEKEIAELREQFAGKAQRYEQERQQRQLEAQDRLMQQIRQAAQRLAKQQGYTVVLDASVVIDAGSAKDLTKEVIGILKK